MSSLSADSEYADGYSSLATSEVRRTVKLIDASHRCHSAWTLTAPSGMKSVPLQGLLRLCAMRTTAEQPCLNIAFSSRSQLSSSSSDDSQWEFWKVHKPTLIIRVRRMRPSCVQLQHCQLRTA